MTGVWERHGWAAVQSFYGQHRRQHVREQEGRWTRDRCRRAVEQHMRQIPHVASRSSSQAVHEYAAALDPALRGGGAAQPLGPES